MYDFTFISLVFSFLVSSVYFFLPSSITKMEKQSLDGAIKSIEEKSTSTQEPRDLIAYANAMIEYIEVLKKDVKTMKPEEIAAMIEENKICKKMFNYVFEILVSEQVRRMNLDDPCGKKKTTKKENKDEKNS